jgi:hypothetical protein
VPIKIQDSTIIDDNRNIISANTITANSFIGVIFGGSSGTASSPNFSWSIDIGNDI